MALGKKATLKVSGGTAYDDLIALAWAGHSWAMEDVTAFDSGVFTETLPTVRTDGPITGTLIYDPTDSDHAALYARAISGASATYVLTFPNGTSTATGDCYLTDWKWDTPAKGLMKANFTLTPAGSMVYAA